ncbi:MAG: segregation/condensation protein A [Armatimonadetes bacterium]|nr:segregation/condensation protein A [Armatimonadota bacterium]
MSRLKENESLTPGGIATPPPLRVESAAFSGSLVTLFHLARDGRIDLVNIPLLPVCTTYVEYLEDIAGEDVDTAGAALLALAYLVERKAWSLLPIAEPPLPQEMPELPDPTAHEYAQAVDTLEEWRQERSLMFFRQAEVSANYEIPFEIGKIKPEDLARTLERLLSKAVPDPIAPHGSPRPSLANLMKSILRGVRERGRSTIEQMLPEIYTRLDVVFVFLAVLELLRIRQLGATMIDGDVIFGQVEKS